MKSVPSLEIGLVVIVALELFGYLIILLPFYGILSRSLSLAIGRLRYVRRGPFRRFDVSVAWVEYAIQLRMHYMYGRMCIGRTSRRCDRHAGVHCGFNRCYLYFCGLSGGECLSDIRGEKCRFSLR